MDSDAKAEVTATYPATSFYQPAIPVPVLRRPDRLQPVGGGWRGGGGGGAGRVTTMNRRAASVHSGQRGRTAAAAAAGCRRRIEEDDTVATPRERCCCMQETRSLPRCTDVATSSPVISRRIRISRDIRDARRR